MNTYKLAAITTKASVSNGTYWTEPDSVTESSR
jgi:hypothetical protein